MAGSHNTPTRGSLEFLAFPFDVEALVMSGLCLSPQILLAFLIDSLYLYRYHLTPSPFTARVAVVSGGFQLLGNDKTSRKLWRRLACQSQHGFYFLSQATQSWKNTSQLSAFLFEFTVFVFGGTELAETAYQNKCAKNIWCHQKWFCVSGHCGFSGKANKVFSSLTNAIVWDHKSSLCWNQFSTEPTAEAEEIIILPLSSAENRMLFWTVKW